MASRIGPCDWPLLGCDDCPDLVALADVAVGTVSRADVEAMAVAWLWSWTGKRYGLCEVTVRPARGAAGGPGGLSAWGSSPALIGGE